MTHRDLPATERRARQRCEAGSNGINNHVSAAALWLLQAQDRVLLDLTSPSEAVALRVHVEQQELE